MRKRLLIFAAAACLLTAPILPCAQDAPTAGKIGLINIQQAIAQTAEGKKALADIDHKYAPKRDELQRDQQQINALQDQLNRQATTLSDQERLRLTRQLEEKQRTFKRLQEDDQSDFQQDSQDAMQRIGQKMVKVIDQYAQQNGYALVVDPVAVNMPVYYVAKGLDITRDIIRLYDTANPAAGSSPAPHKTSAKPKQ